MPIAFPPAYRGPAYAPNSGVEQFTSGFDISNLGIVGAEFTRDSLAPGMALDYNTSRAVNLRNMDYQYEAINFGNQPNPVPAPLMNDGNFVLQFDWAASNSEIVGVTRTSTGAVLANCAIDLFETGSDLVKAQTVSGADGSFTFGNPGTGPFYIVAYKAGSPDVAGTTVNTIMPTAFVYPIAVASTLPQSASIVFNMKADSLVLSDGETVSTWTDSSVNALSFTGTGTFKTNQLGTKPCVRFSGAAGQYMSAVRAGTALDTALTSQVCTTLIVAKSRGTNALGCMFGSNAGGNSNFMVIDGAQTSSAIGRYANNVTGRVAPAVNAADMFVMTHTSTKPYAIGSGSGIEHVYLNGTCVVSDNNPAPVPNQTLFGLAAQGSGGQRAAIDLFEIVVWDRRLTPTEVFQATDYFYDKYSQTKPWAAVSNIVVFDGDSITVGIGGGGAAGSYPYKSAQSLGLTYGQWTNVGVGGITMANMIVKLPEWNGIGTALGKGMRVAAFEYYNQKGNGATAIQTQNNSYATTVRGYANTKLALGTSTSHTADPDATRTSVNSYYDANFATYSDAYVAIHNDTNIGISGAATTDANVTYFSDGVHLKPTGYTVLASLFTTALSSIT